MKPVTGAAVCDVARSVARLKDRRWSDFRLDLMKVFLACYDNANANGAERTIDGDCSYLTPFLKRCDRKVVVGWTTFWWTAIGTQTCATDIGTFDVGSRIHPSAAVVGGGLR